MIIKLFIFVFLVTVISSNASTADCEYSTSESSGYSCYLDVSNLENSTTVTNIVGQHENGKTDVDVLGVWVYQRVRNQDLLSFLCRQFPNLQTIFFQKLILGEIPEYSLTSCRSLQSLKFKSEIFAKPVIKKLPQNLLTENINLTTFDASLYEFRSLPQDFFINNKKLERVRLSQNKINSLPSDIFHPLVNLIEIDLSNNNLDRLNPKWFETLGNLKLLYLSENGIVNIPSGAFKSLGQLNELWLSYNHIKTIHSDSFGVHPYLAQINLIGNKIQSIDEKFIENVGVMNLVTFGNACANVQIQDDSAEKTNIKRELAECFKNYQPRVEDEPVEETTVSLFDKADGQQLLNDFLKMFNEKRLNATNNTKQ